jgi:hypothetical protein
MSVIDSALSRCLMSPLKNLFSVKIDMALAPPLSNDFTLSSNFFDDMGPVEGEALLYSHMMENPLLSAFLRSSGGFFVLILSFKSLIGSLFLILEIYFFFSVIIFSSIILGFTCLGGSF